jgi:lysophospholipase
MMQNKKRTACILFVLAVGLCFFSSITGSRALAYPSTGNTYGLTTEEELEKAFEAEIEDYWNNYGEGGAFTGVDGIEIRYMTFVRPDEKGALVIVSGRTESYIKYKELIYDLGKQGFSLYIYDHRGQGFSGRMAENRQMGHVWDFDHYVEDLKTFYDSVVTAKEHDKIFLLAHSMGGAVASLYIAEHRNDFDGAVLSSPMHEPSAGLLSNKLACAGVKVTSRIRDFFIWLFGWEPRYVVGKGNYKDVPFDRNRLTHSRVRYKKYRELYEENPMVQLGGPTNHWVSSACDGAREARKNAAQITTPVLVLQAEKDTAVTPKGQSEFWRNLKASGKNACEGGDPFIVKGAYHELFIEKDEYRLPAITRMLDFIYSTP